MRKERKIPPKNIFPLKIMSLMLTFYKYVINALKMVLILFPYSLNFLFKIKTLKKNSFSNIKLI